MKNVQTHTMHEAAERLKEYGLLKEYMGVSQKTTVADLSYYSKEVHNGTLFFCKGIYFKEEYLNEALQRGAVGYVSEVKHPTKEPAPYLLVTDIRKALAVLAAWFYGYDGTTPEIWAVTGTKGKSTVVYLLRNILKAAGSNPAFSTTVVIYDGKETVESTLTTPESLDCHRILRTAKDAGCDYFVMEVSSQAYKMQRIYGLNFEYGVFVNIANDHISPNEHKDFEDYFSCKLEIVKQYKYAVINLDDPHADRVLEAAKHAKKMVTYSLKNENADIYARNIRKYGFQSRFEIVTPTGTFETEINMPGSFNVSNALAAAAVAYLKRIDHAAIDAGIRSTSVPGRMNIYEKNGYTVIVDYAHNKTSISVALRAIHEYYPDKKIVVLFGCPGSKALQRRADMAEESAKYAKYVYVTSEDPSYENPYEIAREVTGYLEHHHCPSEIIVDREDAIRQAISELKQDELLLIAGKGSEHYQVVNGVAAPYGGDTDLADRYINEYK
jgi:UDP-N-acetylmuramyl-tripeptide synthetase